MFRSLFLVLAIVCCVSAVEDRTWSEINWGTHLEGPTVVQEDLEGRVLVLVVWESEVLSSAWIKQLTGLRKRFGDKLLVVASHWSTGDRQQVLDNWSIVEGGEYITLMQGTGMRGDTPMDGLELRGGGRGINIRLGEALNLSNYDKATYLFNHEGSLVAQTGLEDAMKRLPAIYKAAPGHLAAGREWDGFAKEAGIVGEANKNFGGVFKKLRKTLASADMLLIEEAQALLDKIEAWATREQAEIERLQEADATACYQLLGKMVALLKGDELGEPFTAMLKTLKKDKRFMGQLKAEAALRAIRGDAYSMGLSRDPEAARRNKSYMNRITKIEKTLNNIVESFPDSSVASATQEMLSAYGF